MKLSIIFKTFYNILKQFGINPLKTVLFLVRLPVYFLHWLQITIQKEKSNINFPFGAPYPCLDDWFAQNGSVRGHYFQQDLLVARKIFLKNPEKHVDVGSRLDGFIAHVASFRPIEVIDIRPTTAEIYNVKFTQYDIMSNLPESLKEYCDSLSCLHALEHIGLGRYGDKVKYDGYITGLDTLYNILKNKGTMYLSVPIGPQRIEFNAHRVFSMRYLFKLFEDRFQIESFSYIDDKSLLFEDVELSDDKIDQNCGCCYGCGIFEIIKK